MIVYIDALCETKLEGYDCSETKVFYEIPRKGDLVKVEKTDYEGSLAIYTVDVLKVISITHENVNGRPFITVELGALVKPVENNEHIHPDFINAVLGPPREDSEQQQLEIKEQIEPLKTETDESENSKAAPRRTSRAAKITGPKEPKPPVAE